VFLAIDDELEKSFGFSIPENRSWERRSWSLIYSILGFQESSLNAQIASSIVDYALGVAFGRWDINAIKYSTLAREGNSPFEPLDSLPRGLLRDDNSGYPIRVARDGIFSSEQTSEQNIISRIQDVFDFIWPENAEEIEQEICDSLDKPRLEDYFSSMDFFEQHLKFYSKSRRQAPIYWPLSTRSGSYTLWLYYHRLTDQTLYTCINDYVEPKLHQLNQASVKLRNKNNRTRDEEKSFETLQSLELELIEFRDELLRIAQLPYKPNLNDGVQITAAPLWKLFGLKKWQTKLKDTWKKLEKGDYDWAHLAYTIWPDRVREKCKGDKSLAIAHDLEALYEVPPEKPKTAKRPRKS